MASDLSPDDMLKPRPAAAAWTWDEAAHLLRRAQFGAGAGEIREAVRSGMEVTVTRLLTAQPESKEFSVAEPVLREAALDLENIDHLKAWWLYRMRYSANPLAEKLCLFWHNHFATSHAKVGSVALMAGQNDLLRRCSVGSFRELLHGISRDPAMLVWLDGNANKKRHANENFAREVMELFSLGVGNYTESDIAEAARAFTGWHVRDDMFWFHRLQHDDGEKTVFGRTGRLDGKDVIELCLAQSACPRFLAEKLLKAFVTASPDDAAVSAMAASLRAHDLQIGPVMGELFRSNYFYRVEHRSVLIKSPVELVVGAFRELAIRPNVAAAAYWTAQLGQNLFTPPTVKGWDGGRLWINSATLLQRANFAAEISQGESLGARFDPARLAELGGAAQQPSTVIEPLTRLLLGTAGDPPLTDRLQTWLRQARGSSDQRLRGLVHLIMTLPEYQLV